MHGRSSVWLLHQHMLKQGNKILNMELWPQALRVWKPLNQKGPPTFSLRWPPIHYCNVCMRRSFPRQLQKW
eukprot:superscaffoldBa00000591_g5867